VQRGGAVLGVADVGHLEHEVVRVVLRPDGHAHVLAAPAVEPKLLEPVRVQRDVGGPVGVERVAARHLLGGVVAVVEGLLRQAVVLEPHLVALPKGNVVVLSEVRVGSEGVVPIAQLLVS